MYVDNSGDGLDTDETVGSLILNDDKSVVTDSANWNPGTKNKMCIEYEGQKLNDWHWFT